MTAQTRPERAVQVLNERLADWPLHTGEAKADFLTGADKDIWLTYRTTSRAMARDTTHFDINILGNTFYLLWIEIDKAARGKGHGNQLYEILTQVAADLGCHRIVQFPSGWVVKDGVKGETRRSYLERRGWKPWGKEEMCKELTSPAVAAIDEGIFRDLHTALRANEGNG